MGMCSSLRPRLLGGAHPPIPPYVPGEVDASERGGGGDGPSGRTATKEELKAKQKADRKRSKSIDKSLKAEKREYKQTHRLLLLANQWPSEERNFLEFLHITDRTGKDLATFVIGPGDRKPWIVGV